MRRFLVALLLALVPGGALAIDAIDKCVVNTGSAGAALTVTLPAAGKDQFHFIYLIEIARVTATAQTGNATLSITTTNFPRAGGAGNAMKWTVGNGIAAGTRVVDAHYVFPEPLQSAASNTDTTIVAPDPDGASSNVIWEIRVCGRIGPSAT